MNWGFNVGLPARPKTPSARPSTWPLPPDIACPSWHAFSFDIAENCDAALVPWEEVDMDESTVLDYPGLPAERIEYWARRAFREWAFRPKPMWTFIRSINGPRVLKSATEIALGTLGWVKS
jgi:hypothetical protein